MFIGGTFIGHESEEGRINAIVNVQMVSYVQLFWFRSSVFA